MTAAENKQKCYAFHHLINMHAYTMLKMQDFLFFFLFFFVHTSTSSSYLNEIQLKREGVVDTQFQVI